METTSLSQGFECGESDLFGSSVALDGDTLVVGAYEDDSSASGVDGNQNNNSRSGSGAAYVFVRDTEGAWSQQAYLKASNPGVEDGFGASLALSGNLLAVGALREDSAATGVNGDQSNNSAGDSGAVYIFVRDEHGVWRQEAYIKASNAEPGDVFGWNVALEQTAMIVAARREDSSRTGSDGDGTDNSSTDSGAVYIFRRSGSGEWNEEAYLKASNAEAGDEFGCSVGMSGKTVVVGARHEGGGASGVDSNQSDNSATDAGAAYVFVRDDSGRWIQRAYLKSSNVDAGDEFGSSVTVAGDTLIVGAWSEDSSSTGIDGDQSNNSESDSGSAYVFSLTTLQEIVDIQFQESGELEIQFKGTLQQSGDLLKWLDLDPQPTSPYRFVPSGDNHYFRARLE